MNLRFKKYMRIARKVHGWFDAGSAAIWDCLLGAQHGAGVTGNLLEIGVWHGKSSLLLAMHRVNDESVLLVDKSLKWSEVERTLQRGGHLEDRHLHIIQGDSFDLDLSTWLPESEGTFRYIHVDGEHTGRAIRNDLGICNRLLAPDGIVCLDDLFSEAYPQVTHAAFEWIAENPGELTLFLVGFNKGYLARPWRVNGYLRYCNEHLVGDMENRGHRTAIWKTTHPADMNCFGIRKRARKGPSRRGPDWDPETIQI